MIDYILYLHGLGGYAGGKIPIQMEQLIIERWKIPNLTIAKMTIDYEDSSPDSIYMDLGKLLLPHCLSEKHRIGIIGNSLGGLFALMLATNLGIKAVLINPPINISKLHSKMSGDWVNQVSHLKEKTFDMAIKTPENYFTFVSQKDETVNPSYAVNSKYLHGDNLVMIPDAAHRLTEDDVKYLIRHENFIRFLGKVPPH